MFALRCTRKVLKLIKNEPDEGHFPTTTALGDWYVNLIPMPIGELLIFVSERSLITVAIPAEEVQVILPQLRQRVSNLLKQIDVPENILNNEIHQMENAQLARTASRSVLGSMNDIASHYQYMVEYDVAGKIQNLEEMELKISFFPHKPIGYEIPSQFALKLLTDEWGIPSK